MNATKLGAICGAAILGFVLSTSIAHADVTYTYTGNDFTNIAGPYTTSESISGTVTLSSALPDNQVTLLTVTPVSFSFMDGIHTITDLK